MSFPDEGTFQYVCALHAWMVGTVVVGSGNPPADEPQPSPEPEETQPPARETEHDRAEDPPPAGDSGSTDAADNVTTDEDESLTDDGNQQESDEAVGQEQPQPDPTDTESGPDHSNDQQQIQTIAADGADGPRHRAALVALAGVLLLVAIGGQYRMRAIRG